MTAEVVYGVGASLYIPHFGVIRTLITWGVNHTTLLLILSFMTRNKQYVRFFKNQVDVMLRGVLSLTV